MIYNINSIDENLYTRVREDYDEGIRDFSFVIDSYGGNFNTALKIYDLLRGDKENVVSARVDGNCFSAATIILLTAPLERRTATKNSSFLCHSPLMPFVGDVNKTTAEQLKSEIDKAYSQLKSIYLERTNSKDVIDTYMSNETSFYADEALALGFISQVETLYNKIDTNKKLQMKKGTLKNIISAIVSQLKNEVYKTKEGAEIEVVSLEVGAPVNGVNDGVYELEDGTVITVEGSVVIDIIPAVAETTEEVEDVKNEETETTEETEEPANVEETVEQVVETVEEAVEEVEVATNEEEIREVVEQAIEELKQEIINKYKPMVNIINELGGMARLIALKNANKEKKNFKNETKKSTLSELMDKIR